MFSPSKTSDARSDASGDLRALKDAIDRHLAANYLDLPGAPLMLCVAGAPGVGKSFTVKRHLTDRHIEAKEISSSAMAHHMEGVAIKPLIRCYRDASAIMGARSACVVIDDIDRSIMANYRNAGHTVHSQLLTGFLMDLCDDPRHIVSEDAGSTRSMVEVERVPIVLTANSVSDLDSALTRPQRMRVFLFEPTSADRCEMITAAFNPAPGMGVPLSPKDVERIESSFPSQPIAFFADLFSGMLAEAMDQQGAAFSGPDAALAMRANREEWVGRLGARVGAMSFNDVMNAAKRLERRRRSALAHGESR